MKLYMFRTVRLSIISSLFTAFHPDPARKQSTNLYDIPLLIVH